MDEEMKKKLLQIYQSLKHLELILVQCRGKRMRVNEIETIKLWFDTISRALGGIMQQIDADYFIEVIEKEIQIN